MSNSTLYQRRLWDLDIHDFLMLESLCGISLFPLNSRLWDLILYIALSDLILYIRENHRPSVHIPQAVTCFSNGGVNINKVRKYLAY